MEGKYEWIDVNVALPEDRQLVKIKDVDGYEEYAYAAYFPFRVKNKKIIPCEPYFDGWMIWAGGKGFNPWVEMGKITHWKATEPFNLIWLGINPENKDNENNML